MISNNTMRHFMGDQFGWTSFDRYAAFIDSKLSAAHYDGLEPGNLTAMFPHQVALTKWALRKGRAAIFADTGLGKTRMQLAWANRVCESTGGAVLVLCPLAVAEQTVREGAAMNIAVSRDDVESEQPGIRVTNYDRLHRFNCERYAGVVLDESSIIKHHDSKTLATLLQAFAGTPYRLCATATPAPNDWMELGTHAEFLGICTRAEMLSEYFVHDGGETQKWRLKGHARSEFWKWVSSWGAMIRSPADLRFDASAYKLPPLRYHEHIVQSDERSPEYLFALEAQTLSERRQARKNSIDARVDACAARVNATADQCIVWCELNAEADALVRAIPDAVEVRGSDDRDIKSARMLAFADGDIRVLVTKPKIAGFGMNWQNCAHVSFVGVTDSFESYYQAVRRCWRFGQTRPVDVHVYASRLEGAVVSNLKRKEMEVESMYSALSAETANAVQAEVMGQARSAHEYCAEKTITLPEFL